MSESEEDASFASADEGEEGKHKATVTKPKEGVGTVSQGDTKTKAQTNVSAKSGPEKQKQQKQQQQRNKKKSNKLNQPTNKEKVTEKPVSPSSSASSTELEASTSAASQDDKTSEKISPASKVESKENKSIEPSNIPPTQIEVPSKQAQSDAPSKQAQSDAPSKQAQIDTPSKQAQIDTPSKQAQSDVPSKQAQSDVLSKQAQSDVLSKQTQKETGSTKQPSIDRNSETTEKDGTGSTKTPDCEDIPRVKDHTPQQEEVLKKLGESAEKGSGWGWGSWGSSLISAATSSVQVFTHQVGDGFSTIIDTVESSLGIPDPEEMARAQGVTEPTPTTEEAPSAVTSQPEELKIEHEVKAEKTLEGSGQGDELGELGEKNKREEEKKAKDSWFSSWGVSDLAKKVTDTGKSIASKGQTLMAEGFDAVENLAAGGIDVLETIGKKTYNTISEHDPAFRKTRDFLTPKGNKPNLSSVLREARDQAEYEVTQAKENEEARKAHFGTLFDDFQGISHLEALEMLSNQSEKKVHTLLKSLSKEDLATIKPLLINIKETFEVDEENESENTSDQDFSTLLHQCLSELELGTAPDKLNKVHSMVKQWIQDFDTHETHEGDNLKELHQKSIQALAELTAKGVEQFHKAGELVLLEKDKDKDCLERAKSLARLTSVLCHEIGNLAAKFVACLNKLADKQEKGDDVTPLVTNVYLEATNSSTYIQDAFMLLLPVLQHAAIEHMIMSKHS
ncbi:protein FAM114A2-like [Physella acuta]|uniref:protein FAM114A2-like n=1 Tax=Physella acuta TaxID=109671 RepID=UPI0027DD2312|nr:protein FAM114A2-like [Physella acuta]